MAGRGMGIATRGGGAVSSGPKNKTISTTPNTTGVPMYKKGGAVKKMMGGGMMTKGASVNKMTKGGAVKKAKGGALMKKKKPTGG